MAGGGDAPRPRPQAREGRRRHHHHQTPSLPLDVILEIAARSDPDTLVRCAATCADVRGRVKDDPTFRRRLRLRHAADGRFVPSLLRGHLANMYISACSQWEKLHMVDIGGPAGTVTARPVAAADGFPPRPDGTAWRRHEPVASRDGLLLIRTTDLTDQQSPPRHELRVCDPATGRSRTLPSEPDFFGDSQPRWEPYVLLVREGGGDGATGISRPFQVLKANLVMAGGHRRYLETQTFSSETGEWGPYAEIRTPHSHGKSLLHGGQPLVAGGAVHWLCVTDSGSYVLKLDIKRAQVSVTALPLSFPLTRSCRKTDYLLATATAGGSPIVLVADDGKISLWAQTGKTPAKWKQRPQVVMDNEAILRSSDNVRRCGTFTAELHWFAERSGLVLIAGFGCGLFWLDLRSMEIVRYSSDDRTVWWGARLPLEMDLSTWAPTFSSDMICSLQFESHSASLPQTTIWIYM